MRLAPVLVLVALAGVSLDAKAEEAGSPSDPASAPAPNHPEQAGAAAEAKAPTGGDRPAAANRTLSTAAAVVPGVVVHGAGHLVAGDPDTGYALLAAEGVGLGLVLAGGSVFLLSGASRYLVAPAAVVTVLGFGLFGFSFAADVYGSASADGGAVERVPRVNALFESELGYRYIAEPRFGYDHFLVENVSFRTGRLRLTPSAWFATNGENARYRIEGAFRLLGAEAGEKGKLSDHIDAVVGGVHHRYGPEHFMRTGAEVALDTRYDLAHIGPTLRGAFVDFGFGYGLARLEYDLPGTDVPGDTDSVLLANIGFGAVLRGKAAPGSEVKIYYDHRHDSYVGGTLMPGLLSGVPGRFGAEARWYFSERIGVLADVQAGSALLGGLSLILREGLFKEQNKQP